MNKFLSTLVVMLGLVISTQAQAAFHIDPFLGYETGKFKSATSESDLSGTGFGARIGYSILGFSMGGEYYGASLKAKGTNGAADTDLTDTDMGVFVGYQFPVLVRAYLTYYASSSAKITGAEFTGSGGTKIGIGYSGLPFVTINLESIARKYNKVKPDGFPSVDSTNESNTTVLSISVPFNI
ncbi:MAG: hypothetical protein BroJett040_16200 [Oligoflexia bacterium]|nr:MAG: hypothetical protein BroJett040_16200 [Oligoflexia bacterium]